MCGRFVASSSPEEVRRWFKTTNPLPNFGASYNVAPTNSVPVVRFNPKTRERNLDLLHWGLIPHWSKDRSVAYKLINARAEGIETKPSFRDAFAQRRCIIPADGFYEWKKTGTGKQPYLIRMKGGGLFGFAGLWENWKDERGEWLRSTTIVTTEPNELCAPIHDRMPVILDPADYARWLGEEEASQQELLRMLQAAPAERMECYPVGAAVGNVKNNGASLIERLPACETAQEMP
jgi:putative SOS response-associated peptidase YedK